MFVIPLSTNRLYTHEILASDYSISQLPTRIGYVMRCSDTVAIYKNDTVFIKTENGNDELEELHHPNGGEIKSLKDAYFFENATDFKINYGKILFSVNAGDFKIPVI